MLKKTLLATVAISATLLAAAVVLPTLAQSRSVASANSAAPVAQPPVDAATQDKRNAADDSGTAAHDQDRRKANGSDHDGRRSDEGRGSAVGKDKDKSRD